MPQVNQPQQPQQSQPEEQYPYWQQQPSPPMPGNYYPSTQQVFPSAQYPKTQPAPNQVVPPVSPPRQPPKKPARRYIWMALAVIVVISAIIYISQVTTYHSPPVNTQATATDMARQTNVAEQLTEIAARQTAGATSNTVTPITDTPTPTATNVPVTPTPTFVAITDGTYQVGTDIQPGTYRTRTGSTGCYYARLKGFSGTVSDILANNFTNDPVIVTILPTDKGFDSRNCGTWTKDLSQITTSTTTFEGGMYIVGTDIQPGTYKSSGTQGCYYARLRGFTGTIGDIIANNFTNNTAIVTIDASDKGFASTRCGTWTRI